jgi:hypothetical protein
MKTDLYIKAVLTVIAFALVCLVFQNFNVVTPAQASTLPAISTVAEPQLTNQVIDVNIKTINGERVNMLEGSLYVWVDNAASISSR